MFYYFFFFSLTVYNINSIKKRQTVYVCERSQPATPARIKIGNQVYVVLSGILLIYI